MKYFKGYLLEDLDREKISELVERLEKGRDYLMTVEPSKLTVEDCLSAFGFGRNGLEGRITIKHLLEKT